MSVMKWLSLLTDLGFREDKTWDDRENELLFNLCKLAEEHANYQLEQVNEWLKDGR